VGAAKPGGLAIRAWALISKLAKNLVSGQSAVAYVISISEDPSTMTSLQGRPEQGKFSKEEVNFLKTHLPAYGALCDGLAKQATGSRGTGSVKGCKKDWILSKVFPEFVKRFSSDQSGGPQLQSLQVVSYLLWLFIVGSCLNASRNYCDGSRITHLIGVLV